MISSSPNIRTPSKKGSIHSVPFSASPFYLVPVFSPNGASPRILPPSLQGASTSHGMVSFVRPLPTSGLKKKLPPSPCDSGGQDAWVSYVQTSLVIDGTWGPWPTKRGLGRCPSNSRYGTFSRVPVRPKF